MSDALLSFLLGGKPATLPSADVRTFWSAWQGELERWTSLAERAAAGGFAADRLGYAFATGYQAALCALCSELPSKHMTGLCATEEGGNHPRAIQSRLEPDGDGFRLSGEKRWATLAPLARELLVVASFGSDESGRNRLRVVRVETSAQGVAIEPLADTPFVPEIPHAVVRFDGVKIAGDRVLPGDGYDRYLKPFRTVEDIHVHLAGLGYLIGVARRAGFGEVLVERAVALLVSARALAALEPLAAETHVALAGLLAESRRLFEDCEPEWSKAAEEERTRWQRDRVLFTVAERARSARQKSAWDRLKGT
jgi:alkylation response protein AidB-like acyl-CoA dehydrogenase